MTGTPTRTAGLDRLLRAAVEARPQAPALITGPGRAPVGYAELAALVDELAARLAVGGLRPGDLVALEAANSVEFVTGLLGAARAGLVVAPIDPALAHEERADRLDRLGARVVLADPVAAPTNATDDGDCPTWKLTFTPSELHLTLDTPAPPRPTPPDSPELSADDALVMFTAGTTGRPKMIPWTQRNVEAVLGEIRACYELSPADATVAVMPFFHGHGLIAGLLAPLAGGGCILLPAGGRFSAHTFWADLAAAGATWFTAVPTIVEILLAQADTEHRTNTETRLRFVRTCSAPLNPDTARAFELLTGAPVLAAYGMTETTHQAASQPFAHGPGKPGTVGRPTGVEARIVDDGGGRRPAGAVGEIWVKGPTVTRGYLGDAAETARTFTDGWYHTGDLGTLDRDGRLTVTGRIKTLINRGGEKIAPEHVEEILDRYPAIAESAVLGRPDPILGERVVALVVPRPGRSVDPDRVLEACRDRLARYEVPDDIKVVKRIPHTAKGAIDRTAALAAYQSTAS